MHQAAIPLQDPNASVGYDSAAHTARREMLDLAAEWHDLAAAAHIAFPGLVHIRKGAATYQWVPVSDDAAPGR